ncbi:hypothetical protein NC653_016615 [Populus alba x Populus x berolinensis]|uniref:AP2/ERF domain-containing protein n=1 Tax=Populus alba x Populus x berolinensis TaxID=444605 RepID=A0AAD6QN86_9ROSI|nr:hypothetical protein NC653_016615 [Populus alba x Populus x berolinensis]
MVKFNTEKPVAERGDSKYRGVRKRKWGRWVSEIRLPNSRERIWLGSYDSAEKAAHAFDAALFCLRGNTMKFNFSENPPNIAHIYKPESRRFPSSTSTTTKAESTQTKIINGEAQRREASYREKRLKIQGC